MTFIDLALGYAEQGWPVFPIEPRGKRPLGLLAPHGLKDATTDADQIRRWWTAQPDANIGIPTGIAFDVGDFDTADAVKRFQALCPEHNLDARKLTRIATGRGGRHVLWAPTGIGNRAGVIPGMDWRGKGGYIVAPGSIHPNGEVYRWVTQPNGQFPTAPDWMIELLDPKQPARFTEKHQAQPNPPPETYLRAATTAEIGAVRLALEGTRNDMLN